MSAPRSATTAQGTETVLEVQVAPAEPITLKAMIVEEWPAAVALFVLVLGVLPALWIMTP